MAVGAVLLQTYAPAGTLLPCAYYSRNLLAPECNYTIWEKELLVKVAFETWQHHLEGARRQVEDQMDHRNLEHLQTAQMLNQHQVRCRCFLLDLTFG